MTQIVVQGGKPLNGFVKVSGSKKSAIKLIYAAMFSNEDVILENVPRLPMIETDLKVIESVGGKYTWLSSNKLMLNGSGINSYSVPYEIGSLYRTTPLIVGPLLYRFGEALIPLTKSIITGTRPINRWLDTWEDLGLEFNMDANFLHLQKVDKPLDIISFKTPTHMGTDNAILSSLYLQGTTTIKNSSHASEVDDLIDFCNMLGAKVRRDDDNGIVVEGSSVFKGGTFRVQPDRDEVATFATLALITKGNISITGVEKSHLLAFVNVLTKLGLTYEFFSDELRVWYSGVELQPTDIKIAPSPGFITDWQPLITLLLTQARGESLVYDTVYTDSFSYVRELNRLGASIQMLKPSEAGFELSISNDFYDMKSLGEPSVVAKVHGPTDLRGTRLTIEDAKAGAVLVLAALAASNKSEISGYEHVAKMFENFDVKLRSLGAQIDVILD